MPDLSPISQPTLNLNHPPRTLRLHLLPILSTALILRIGLAWVAASRGTPASFFGQATELGQLTASFAAGRGLSSPFGGATGPSAFLSPGYPALVAALFAIFQPFSYASALTLTILQALFGTTAVALLMHLGRRLFGNRTANLAGILCAISPPLICLTTMFWETALTTLLFLSLLALAVACSNRPTSLRWVAAGALSALVLAVNPSLLPVICCAFGWAAWQSRRASIKPLLYAVATCLLLSAPWAIRNQRTFHAFIPLRSNLAYELWQGNRPSADGFFAAELHPNNNPREFAQYQALGEIGYMRQKSTIANAAIRANPRRFLSLTAKRIACFWTGMGRIPAPTLVTYILLTTLGGATGLCLFVRRCRQRAMLFILPLIFFPAPYYITHPDARFRLVLDPVLILLTAYALTSPLKRNRAEPSSRRRAGHKHPHPHPPA